MIPSLIIYIYVSSFCRILSLQSCFSPWLMHIYSLSIQNVSWNSSQGIASVSMSSLTQSRQEEVNLLWSKTYVKPVHIYDDFLPLKLHQLIFFFHCVFLTPGARHPGIPRRRNTPSTPSWLFWFEQVPEQMLNRCQGFFSLLNRRDRSWLLIPRFLLFLYSRVSPSQELLTFGARSFLVVGGLSWAL